MSVMGIEHSQGSGLTAASASELSERDARILDFENHWWRHQASKEESIRDLFAMSATEYYQILNGLIDTHAALAHSPMLVKRLRRQRAERQRARSARRGALGG